MNTSHILASRPWARWACLRLPIGLVVVTALWLAGCKTASLFSRDTAKPIQIGSASEALEAIRTSRDPNMRRAAFEYLGDPRNADGDEPRRDEFTDILTLALSSESDVNTRVALVRSIERLGSVKRTDALLVATNDKEPPVRALACRMLGRHRAVEAQEKLQQMLASDPAGQVRIAAAEALGNIPTRESALALATGLTDSDVAIRYRCQESLRKMMPVDHAGNVEAWREQIQTANFEELARTKRTFGLF